MSIEFEWALEKAESNIQKHGIGFPEAATVFGDTRAITIWDEAHSTDREDRLVTLGMSAMGPLVVVVHVDLDDQRIRIISARPATRKEQSQYTDL